MNQNLDSAAASMTGDDSGEAGTAGDSPATEPPRSPARPPLRERLFGFWKPRNGSNLRENLTDALAEAADEADFSPAERAMLNNILRLREVRVEDVMIPRADIQAVEIGITLGDLLKVFEQSGHSRMPVYAETLDDPRGMVHIRDVVSQVTRLARQKKGRGRATVGDTLDLGNVDLSRNIGELSLVRPLLFVPPSMAASDLMARMQAARIQMALVIDEYGGTDGLASLEDIVEMVVGDISDEHDDDEEPLVTKTADGVFLVDGKAEIDDVQQMIGESFDAGEHEDDVDTIGGLIFNVLGRVPARGEVVQAIPGFEFQVLDADPRRVKRVRIIHLKTAERRRRQARAASAPLGSNPSDPPAI